MKKLVSVVIWLFVLGCALGLVLMFSSVSADECTARVEGGKGTIADPLKIMVSGDAGLTPFIDSLLPFRALPCVLLSYEGERFYVPGINAFVKNGTMVAKGAYLVSLVVLANVVVLLVLRLFGRRIRVDKV